MEKETDEWWKKGGIVFAEVRRTYLISLYYLNYLDLVKNILIKRLWHCKEVNRFAEVSSGNQQI